MPNRLIDGRDNPINRTGLYKPIVGVLFTAIIAFIFYQLGEKAWTNQLSTFIISFSFIQGALVVVAFTDNWKWRIVGIFVALGGGGLAYLFLFLTSIGYLEINTLAIRSTLRSALSVGGSILALGTWAYLYNRRRKIGSPDNFLDPRSHYRQP
jgi:hypothetical protein